MKAATMLALCFACVGCGGPPFTLESQPSPDSSQTLSDTSTPSTPDNSASSSTASFPTTSDSSLDGSLSSDSQPLDARSESDAGDVDAHHVDAGDVDADADAAPPWVACAQNYASSCAANPSGCIGSSVCTACPGACDGGE